MCVSRGASGWCFHYAKGPGNFGRKLIAWDPFRFLPTGIKNLWRWSTYSDRNSPFCFDKLVHCPTSFYLYRELGKEIKNGKSYSSWLVQFHRKLQVGLVQWKAPLKINFIKASLWTLVSRWKTNWFSKFEGWDELRKLLWNYSFIKKSPLYLQLEKHTVKRLSFKGGGTAKLWRNFMKSIGTRPDSWTPLKRHPRLVGNVWCTSTSFWLLALFVP